MTSDGEVGNGVGVKKKASNDSDESSVPACITADQQHAKNAKVKVVGDGRVSLHNLDLLSNIAFFMPPGKPLVCLCVAAGPMGAAHIRQAYLTDNDAFVSCALRDLINVLNKYGSGCYGKIQHANGAFDKCKDSIRAWMQHNDWKSRCTESNLKRYKKHKMARFHEANFPFNCLNFALELGLLEVTRYLVEDRLLSLNDGPSSWDRLVYGGFRHDYIPLHIAIVRGDVATSDYLLNMGTHDEILRALRLVLDEWNGFRVSYKFLSFLTRHPRMILNDDILLMGVEALEDRVDFFARREDRDYRIPINRSLERFSLLLELANSRGMKKSEFPSALDRAKNYLSKAKRPLHRETWNKAMEKIAISLPVG